MHCEVTSSLLPNVVILDSYPICSSLRYDGDGEFHRAVIEVVGFERGRATVIFVDYGTRDSVQLKNIRLDIKFEEIPILAVRCTLYNIRVPGSGNQLGGVKALWSKETLDILHKMIVDHEFRVTIKNKGLPLQVLLHSDSIGSVAEKLVEQSLAELTEFVENKPTSHRQNRRR